MACGRVGAQSQGDPLARLSLWRDLVAKVRAEGTVLMEKRSCP